MFCFDAGCERALCAACPLAEHVGHVMRGLQENMADAQEIRQMEQQLSAHRNSLDVSSLDAYWFKAFKRLVSQGRARYSGSQLSRPSEVKQPDARWVTPRNQI